MSSASSKNLNLSVIASKLVDLSKRDTPATPHAVLDSSDSIFYALAVMAQQNVDVGIVVNAGVVLGLLHQKDLIVEVAKRAMEVEEKLVRLNTWFDVGQTFMLDASAAAANIIEQVEEQSVGSNSLAIKSQLANARILVSEIPMLMTYPDAKIVTREEVGSAAFLTELVSVLRYSSGPRGVSLNVVQSESLSFVANSSALAQAAKHIVESRIRTAPAGAVIKFEAKHFLKPVSGVQTDMVKIQVTVTAKGTARTDKKNAAPYVSLADHLVDGMLSSLSETHDGCSFSTSGSSEDVVLEMIFPIVASNARKLSKFSAIKVLVVEDDLDILELVAETISGHGFQVITAVNGQEALAKYISHRPELVLTDVNMPILNGFRLSEEIRKIDPNGKIIIFSGEYPSLLEDCSDGRIKCDLVLYKPFAQKDILETVLLIV